MLIKYRGGGDSPLFFISKLFDKGTFSSVSLPEPPIAPDLSN